MKRNMDLIRALLLHYEGEDPVCLEKWDSNHIEYHTKLLHEAGLVKSSETYLVRRRVATTGDLKEFHEAKNFPTQLTWEGYEFLDKARDESIWNKAKVKAGGGLTSIGYSLLANLLESIIKKQVGIS